jgi:single-stranded DNA-binding protein
MVRQTAKGQSLGRFALAVPIEDGSARYETILVFGERVKPVQELHKGDSVQVIGYLHEREVTGRDGTKKMRREVYATVVRSR